VSSGKPEPAARVDALGLLCPLPILRTEQAARGLGPGAVIEVLADDAAIVEDLPAWCEGRGHHLVVLRQEIGSAGRPRWRALVRLGRRAGDSPA
jgi:TusA-related sulfurtransferase